MSKDKLPWHKLHMAIGPDSQSHIYEGFGKGGTDGRFISEDQAQAGVKGVKYALKIIHEFILIRQPSEKTRDCVKNLETFLGEK